MHAFLRRTIPARLYPSALLYNLTTSCRLCSPGHYDSHNLMRPSTAKLEEAGPVASSKLGERSVSRIGNTPLLRLECIARDLPNVQFLGKAEWYNPGGSVKDRAAFNIVSEGRRSGKFASSKTLLDSTSGNTGIA